MSGVRAAEDALDAAAAAFGGRLGADGPALLRERAAILGVAPDGAVSAGGTARLLPAAHGAWVAINLARRDDVTSLAAWMGHEWQGDVWGTVGAHLARTRADAAVERAQLLGIPAAVAAPPPRPAHRVPREGAPARRNLGAPVVVDLSALWAGPLCARLLGGLGADVVKVEHAGRPDGARRGHPEFWARLNRAKHEVTLDFERGDGRAALDRLLERATVVVTAARPRAISQLRLELARRVRERGLLWVSITGYGSDGDWRERVAFGDDAAVAGGLAVAAGGVEAPVFVGDAPADPLAGLQGAAEAAVLVERGAGGLVDISMRDAIAGALTAQRYAAASAKVGT